MREKKSRFLSLIQPAETSAQAKEALEKIRSQYPDANHHCWAWRLGNPPLERSSDDGEPAGTAGLPMLQVLRGAPVSDLLAVVVRWFGGVKLGKGGLVRAYGDATRLALETLPIYRRVPTSLLRVELPYGHLGAIKRWVHPPAVQLVSESYGQAVSLVLAVHDHHRPAFEESLASLGLEACLEGRS